METFYWYFKKKPVCTASPLSVEINWMETKDTCFNQFGKHFNSPLSVEINWMETCIGLLLNPLDNGEYSPLSVEINWMETKNVL